MNTETISTGIIAVDYSKSLQNMMADGSFDWVNPAITPKGFPITAVGIVQFETKVFHFNRYISSEDAVELSRPTTGEISGSRRGLKASLRTA
jgi:hypothetical protein